MIGYLSSRAKRFSQFCYLGRLFEYSFTSLIPEQNVIGRTEWAVVLPPWAMGAREGGKDTGEGGNSVHRGVNTFVFLHFSAVLTATPLCLVITS